MINIYKDTESGCEETITRLNGVLGLPDGKGTTTAAVPYLLEGSDYYFPVTEEIYKAMDAEERTKVIVHNFDDKEE